MLAILYSVFLLTIPGKVNVQEPAPNTQNSALESKQSRLNSAEITWDFQYSRAEQDEFLYILREPRMRAPNVRISADRGVLIFDAAKYKESIRPEDDPLKPGPGLPPASERDLLDEAKRRAGGEFITKGPLLNLQDAPFRDALRVLYFEGNVRVFHDTDKSLSASALFLDITTGRLLLIDGRLRYDFDSQGRPVSLSLRSKLLRQEISGFAQLKDADITLCGFSVPHYHIHASDLSLTSISKEEILMETADSYLQIEDSLKLPLPDMGLYSTDLRYLPLESISVGHSRRDGTFLRTRWGHSFRDLGNDFNRSIGVDGDFRGRWAIDLDMLSARGPAIGGTLEYATPGSYRGKTTAFLMSDRGGNVGFLSDVYDEHSATRGRIHTENRIVTGNRSWLDFEFSSSTDPLLRPEFFPAEFKTDKEHENIIYYRTAGDSTSFTALGKTQLNSFEPINEYGVTPGGPSPSATNAYPFLDGRFYPTPIADLPLPGGLTKETIDRRLSLVYRGRVDAGYLERHYSEGDISPNFVGVPPFNPLDQQAFRFDTVHELSTPFSLGIAKLVPFFELRETAADHSVPTTSVASGLGESTEGIERTLLTAGARIGSHFERDFGKIRHLADFRIDYRNQFESTEDGNRFITFDEVDALDKMERVDFDLRNRLSARDPITGTRWTFVDFRALLPYYPDSNRDNGGDNFGPLRADARLDFGSRFFIPDLRVRSRALMDPYKFFTQKSDTTAIVSPFGPETDLSISYRESSSDYRAIALGLSTRIDRKWDLDIVEQYDFVRNRAIQQKIALRRYGHDWAFEISFSIDTNENSQSVSFAILPLLGSSDRPRDRFFIPEPTLRGFY